jgi:hypothetical protein
MQQILKETKIKYIYYTNNSPFPTYEKTNTKELLISNNLIITNPQEYHNSVLIIDRDNDQFETLVEGANYVDIISDSLFLIRISNSLILKTKSFNYFNGDTPISIEVANGWYDIDEEGALAITPEATDIKIEYVVAKGI